MALDEPQEDDNALDVNGVNVLFTNRAQFYIEGATIDYVKEEHREGFVIKAREPDAPCLDDDW
jgi:Fe-S cluster assembly iron-binding protein IscA